MSDTDADRFESELVKTASDGALFAFDVPAFVRRGQDVESILDSLEERCRRRRSSTLDMVHMRLRQWAKLATGPMDWRDVFASSIEGLWTASHAEAPAWAAARGSARGRKSAARDLTASVERFNARWLEYVDRLDLGLINRTIDHYNEYYVIEKECVLGSARLAAMHFTPILRVSTGSILGRYPTLPVPQPIGL